MTRTPAFSEAMRRAKTAFNAQATREGRQRIGEHDLEEAVWAVYELLIEERKKRGTSTTPGREP
ncbi:MAG: hypothetical protein ACREL3_04620 [Gemmatimonadales bacterium]